MSKVLYIGNYGEQTGWGIAGLNNILALDSAGVEVVPRRVKFQQQVMHPRLIELEKNEDKCDVCIQHVLPHMLTYNSAYKNIAYFAYETADLSLTGWAQYLNLMDEVWVPTEFVRQVCIQGGVTVPIKVVPHCIDLEGPQKAAGFNLKAQVGEEFLFLSVADFNRRKNIAALLRAFHTEFRDEPVGLVLKTTNQPEMEKFCEEIRKGLKLPIRKKETIIGPVSEGQMLALYKSCDVFVCPSYGEGFCIPVLEAMSCGVPSIVTNWSGLPEVVGETGWKCDYRLEPCFGSQTFPFLNTGLDRWASIDIVDLMSKMREAYKNDLLRKKKGLSALKRSFDYSREQVGELMKDLLNEH